MKNIIEFFYNVEIEKIIMKNNYYFFNYNNYTYMFKECNNNLNFEIIYETQKYNLFHTIIYNKNNEIITFYENKKYILMRINIKENRKINTNDIINISFLNKKYLYKKINYKSLWENKIDKFEEFIENKRSELPFKEYYNYYIGLGENALQYLNFIIEGKIRYTFSYRRINVNDTLFELYDPTNIIIAPITRTMSEYIKNSFFYNEKIEIDFLDKIKFYNDEMILLVSRLLFPTYFFDIHKQSNYQQLKKIINNSHNYEKYIYYLIKQIRDNGYEVPLIKWLSTSQL